MDQKKQDLNPELKQIYDRVMNTQVSKPEAGQTQAAPQAPLPANAPVNTPTPPANPVPNLQQTQAPPPGPALVTSQATSTPAPSSPLSSAQPRPVQEKKSFVFTGNKVITPQGQPGAAAQALSGAKKGLSGKVIIVLVVVLIAVWGVFWAKIFDLF